MSARGRLRAITAVGALAPFLQSLADGGSEDHDKGCFPDNFTHFAGALLRILIVFIDLFPNFPFSTPTAFGRDEPKRSQTLHLFHIQSIFATFSLPLP